MKTHIVNAAITIVLMEVVASGEQLVVGAFNPGKFQEYSTSGTLLNPSFASGDGYGIATDGTDVFVLGNQGHNVSEYTVSGTLVNSALVTGLTEALSIAVADGVLYVGDAGPGTIRSYSTSGIPINTSLVTGFSFLGAVAVEGDKLFAADISTGKLGEYTTAGVAINSSLITGLSPLGIAISGDDLFIADGNAVAKYTTSGLLENRNFITGFHEAGAIAISGSDMYVGDYVGTEVYKFSTSGTLEGFLGLLGNGGIAVIPEPSTWTLLAMGAGTLLAFRRRPLHAAVLT